MKYDFLGVMNGERVYKVELGNLNIDLYRKNNLGEYVAFADDSETIRGLKRKLRRYTTNELHST